MKPYEMYQSIQDRQESIRDAKVGTAKHVVELVVDNVDSSQIHLFFSPLPKSDKNAGFNLPLKTPFAK